MNLPLPAQRSLTVIPVVIAALALSTMPAPTASAASAPAQAPAQAAPQSAGSASDFLFYVYPDPQPVCGSPVGLNASDDPAIDRASCSFLRFTGTGITGAVTANLYGEGEDTPFATLPVTASTTTVGQYTTTLEPDATWPFGRIRIAYADTAGPIGEYSLLHNALRLTALNGGAPTAPDTGFSVTGTIAKHSARATFSDAGVPAAFTLEVTAPDVAIPIYTAPVTAAANGTFTAAVPASATAGITPDASNGHQVALGVRIVEATWSGASDLPPTGAWGAKVAGTTTHVVATTPDILGIENSFVSSVGWVKPGETYPSSITVTNPTAGSVTPTSVVITAPTGSTILKAGAATVNASTYTWNPGAISAGASKRLVLESKAATTASLPTVVWRDLSTTAVLKVSGKADQTAVSHGPKVIPPSDIYDTARYGDRPFPIVPVQYTDRPYQSTHNGDSLEGVINDPNNEGSTFNLFQEMSLGQLFPDGTVPSAGIGSADFGSYAPGFDFTARAIPGNTCTGDTFGSLPFPVTDTPLYPERITDGVYNLPGTTGYYGSDSNGSAVVGSLAGVGALQNIDSGCGDTGKMVYDAAAIADPEIDYSDYDTDKDGVVDFFMVVFAGCGGNGSSQLSVAGCDYPDAPYDNVWPHSSSLENGYTDPVTGLPGFTTDDQLKDLEGRPLWYTDTTYTEKTTTDTGDALKVFVRVGPYNVNPETAIDFASVISHEYGHSLGLPDFYSTGGRETYGDWNLMATDQSQNMDAFSRQELGWVVPQVLDSSRTETAITDSKEDIGEIQWQTPDGTPYTLTDGVDGTVHNSQMFVAKLPGRKLLDESAFTTGEGASPSHLWWSGSGNDFGCAPSSGRNFDLSIPQLAKLTDPAATVTLSFKSRWDIEWDFDYGYVLTTTDGGNTYTSHESENGYTTSNTDPTAGNPNTVGCQTTYDNGITGSSGSYEAGTEATDRKLGEQPPAVFLEDSFDISDLAGAAQGALRFSYSTDPGLARPGWFIDDVKVTVDPDGAGGEAAYDIFASDFETSGGPADTRVFNGGCRESLTTATKCTLGWKYLQAGAESVQDHAYYMEMRDRSGFDLDGNGQADRGGAAFQPGFYLSYTDETHGYGNAGTDSPPAQSPLDSVPQVGNETPNLDDAAFTGAAARKKFSDNAATPWVDNYEDPSSDSGNWEFGYGCLDFTVDSMSGETNGPQQADGDLTGDVTFSLGSGCGEFDYGYVAGGGGGDNTAPVAAAASTPTTVEVGDRVRLSGAASTDAETPNDLDYSWNFDNGGSTKDASTRLATVTYTKAGTFTPTLTVTDPQGLSSTARTTVVVKDTKPVARLKISPKKPFVTTKIKLSGGASTGTGPLSYSWNFGDGGSKQDASGATVRTKFKKAGYRKVTLTVTDDRGRSDSTTRRVLVRRAVACNARAVKNVGSWRRVKAKGAPKGDYCDNRGRGKGKDTLTYSFKGKQLDVYHGRDNKGGKAKVFIDGKRVGTVNFKNGSSKLKFRFHQKFKASSNGKHTVKLVVTRGTAYIDSFITNK